MNYTAKVVEICDNGDAIVELPPELVEELGWEIGDRLNMELIDGQIVIENLDRGHRNKSLDKPA
jgi:antitoxin component of MazEF toxin-antitoxin module